MALMPISRLDDYRFPEDAWDVRGWTVRTEVGDERVGKVEDMLLDGNGTLRYLDVDLGFLKRHVLVPMEAAFAERDSETVRIEGMSKDELEDVPEFAVEPESLDESYERRLMTAYGAPLPTGATRPLDRGVDDSRQFELDNRELELRRMEALDDEYEVAGEDPRGWDVVTADGKEVGEVSELLMDPGAMKARFLDVTVDEEDLKLERVDRHILLPAERVRLERNKKRVVVGGLLASDVARYPQYGGLPLHSRTARELDEFFDRAAVEDAGAARDRADREAREPAANTTLRHFYRSADRSGRAANEGGYNG